MKKKQIKIHAEFYKSWVKKWFNFPWWKEKANQYVMGEMTNVTARRCEPWVNYVSFVPQVSPLKTGYVRIMYGSLR